MQRVAGMRIADARLREQARKSAAACALNVAEGAARVSRADKARVFGIARAEACEAAAAVEIAAVLKAASAADAAAVVALAVRVKNLLAGLMR
jgi:four helix bundle protein